MLDSAPKAPIWTQTSSGRVESVRPRRRRSKRILWHRRAGGIGAVGSARMASIVEWTMCDVGIFQTCYIVFKLGEALTYLFREKTWGGRLEDRANFWAVLTFFAKKTSGRIFWAVLTFFASSASEDTARAWMAIQRCISLPHLDMKRDPTRPLSLTLLVGVPRGLSPLEPTVTRATKAVQRCG